MDKLLEFIAGNTLLAAGTVAMALAVIFNELRIKASGLTAIAAGQAVRLINNGAKVVDVRDAESFAKGHIVDSINVPGADISDKLNKKLKKASSVILVLRLRHAQWSARRETPQGGRRNRVQPAGGNRRMAER